MRNAIIAVALASVLIALGFTYLFVAPTQKSHAEYLRDTYQITADYVAALDGIDGAPPEVTMAFALSAERILSGPGDVQRLIARGEYRAVQARIKSMRRDLAELEAYQASR